MTAQIFTLANQLTLLRMLLIPAFVLLVVYGYFGWALTVFIIAGATDALDGLIARLADQRTDLGAWLDPAADKLLLVTAFIVLTLPNLGLVNRIPIWLTILVISRDVGIVAHRRHRQPCARSTHVQAVAAGQRRDRLLHRDLRDRDVFQLPGHDLLHRRGVHLDLAGSDLVSGIDYVFRVAKIINQ